MTFDFGFVFEKLKFRELGFLTFFTEDGKIRLGELMMWASALWSLYIIYYYFITKIILLKQLLKI
jgi:hypothetical protein